MKRVTFPDGQWVDVYDAAEITERARRTFLAACSIEESTTGSEKVVAIRRAEAIGTVATLAAWSYDQAASVDALEDLPSLRYDEIGAACADTRKAMSWTILKDPAEVTDPKASTDDSNSSDPG